MPQAFYILLGATLTVATAIALGRLLFRALALRFPRGEEYVFALVTGAACLSLLVFALTAVGLAYKAVFLGLAVLAIVPAMRRSRIGSPACPAGQAGLPILLLVFVAFTCLYFFNAMAPEISPDGATYHLGLVSRYLREHGFHRITTDIYASLSQGFEMLFLFAFAFGRHSAAALVHFAFTVALALAMFFYGRRIGQPLAGAAGALFVFCSPVVGIDGSSAYNDVGVACVLFTVFYLLQIWDQERTSALLIPIGLVAGFGYAIKYTAFLAVPYALGFVAWKSRNFTAETQRPQSDPKALKPPRPLRLCGEILVLALVMIVPWMAKNWLWVQNPVSPFLNQLFPNPYVHISFEKEYAHHMRHYEGLASYWQIPWQVTADGSIAGGILGPLFLLAPFSLLALRNRHGRQLLLAALVFGVSYAANVGTRFLIPALPFIALAMALVFARWRVLVVALVLAHALLSWPTMINKYAPRVWRLSEIPVRAALRIEPEEHFLARKCIPYVIGRTIESFVPPGKRVFAPTPTGEAYTGREILVTYEGALNQVIGDMLWTPWVPRYAATRRLTFHFSPDAFRQLRVVQTASDDLENWSIAEFHLARYGRGLGARSRMAVSRQALPVGRPVRLRPQPHHALVQLAVALPGHVRRSRVPESGDSGLGGARLLPRSGQDPLEAGRPHGLGRLEDGGGRTRRFGDSTTARPPPRHGARDQGPRHRLHCHEPRRFRLGRPARPHRRLGRDPGSRPRRNVPVSDRLVEWAITWEWTAGSRARRPSSGTNPAACWAWGVGGRAIMSARQRVGRNSRGRLANVCRRLARRPAAIRNSRLPASASAAARRISKLCSPRCSTPGRSSSRRTP